MTLQESTAGNDQVDSLKRRLGEISQLMVGQMPVLRVNSNEFDECLERTLSRRHTIGSSMAGNSFNGSIQSISSKGMRSSSSSAFPGGEETDRRRHFSSQFFKQLELNTPFRFLPLIARIRARHERRWIEIEERYGVGNLLIYLHAKTGISMLTWGLVLVSGATLALDFLFLHFAPLFSYLVGLCFPLLQTQKLLVAAATSSITTAAAEKTQMTGKSNLLFWLRYWTIFSSIQFLDQYLPFRLHQRLPLFPILKSVFYIWLYHPGTRGANIIYQRFLDPLPDPPGSPEEVKSALLLNNLTDHGARSSFILRGHHHKD